MNTLIIFGAKYLVLVPVIVTGYLLYVLDKPEKIRFLGLLLIGGSISLILAKVAGHLYFSARPFVTDGIKPLLPHGRDNGFPSDHTLLGAFLAYACFLLSKRIGGLLLIVAILVGLARVNAGVHHGIDIVGAFVVALLGIAAAYGFTSLQATKKPS